MVGTREGVERSAGNEGADTQTERRGVGLYLHAWPKPDKTGYIHAENVSTCAAAVEWTTGCAPTVLWHQSCQESRERSCVLSLAHVCTLRTLRNAEPQYLYMSRNLG